MALVLKDRVLENSLSTGTGSFTLAGPQVGYQSFSVIGNGNTTYYTIQGKYSNGNLNGEWEVGVGTWSTGNILSRDTVLESSNSNNLVVFSAGDKDVFCDLPAEKVSPTDVLGTMAYQNANAVNITGGIVDVDAGTAALPTLGTTGDPNTGIFFPAADNVAVATNGAERMRITSAGNVGIGTTTIYSKLHVGGSAASSWQSILATGVDNVNFRLVSYNGDAGATSGTLQARFGLAYNDFSTTAETALFKFYRGAGAADGFLTAVTNNSERMRITSTGNVGIGTTNPTTKFNIQQNTTWGTATLPAVIIGVTGSGGTVTNPTGAGSITWQADNGTGFIANIEAIRVAPDTGNLGAIVFRNNITGGSSNTLTETMRINSSGNVGIGTTSPSGQLSVSNAGAEGIELDAKAIAGTARILAFNRTTSAENILQLRGSVQTFITSNSERMRIHASGGVSIGNTTDPGAANLNVTGSANIQTLTVGLGGGAVATNTAVGYQAINVTSTGGGNTAGGYQSLNANTSGTNNTSWGYLSLTSSSTGVNNTAIGSNALAFNTLGSSNTANGYYALRFNTTASALTAIGAQALQSNTTNVATLGTITGGTGYTNGTYTGVAMALSSGSTAITYPTATIVVAGGVVTTVTITSAGVGFKDTTTVLTALAASIGGTGSGFSVPVATLASGSGNTAVGYQAGFSNTIGTRFTAVGYQAGYSNTNSVGNSSFGYNALYSNTTGGSNTAIGDSALFSVTTAIQCTSVGMQSILYNTGNYNTALGYRALFGVSGTSTGGLNTAVGVQAGVAVTTGTSCVFAGYQAGFGNTTGSSNIAIGSGAGYGPAGVNANTTGSNNIYVGHQTVGSAATNTNEMVIGYAAVGNGSNTTTIGNTSTTLTKVFGVIQSTTYTVASLPSATTSGVGARAFVTDALAPTFGATVVTGGAVATPVYSDGTNWKVG